MNANQRDSGEAERKHERSLRSTDPRVLNENQQPRMNMLDDEPVSNVERGTELETFIEPE